MITNLRGVLLALGLTCGACQVTAPPPVETADPALSSYVLSAVPSDLANRTYLDFGGKVALVGYTLEPAGIAAPGSHVKLTLYWQSLGALGPDWSLFTHLVIPRQPHRVLDNAGPLRKLVPAASGGQRQALPPSLWERGKVYVDPLEFDIPPNIDTPEVTVVAGVWRDALRVVREGHPEDAKALLPGLRLPVLSGACDDMQRGIIVHISTGLPERAPKAAPTPRLRAKPALRAPGAAEANGNH